MLGHRIAVPGLTISHSTEPEVIGYGPSYVREFTWVFVEFSAGALFALVGVKLLTNMLSLAAFGQYALGLTFALGANLLFFGPFGQTVLRFVSEFNADGTLHTGYYILRRVWVLGSSAVLLCGLAVTALVHGYAGVAIGGVMLGIAEGTANVHAAAQSALRNRRVVALHAVALNVMRFGFAGLAMLWFGSEAWIALCGSALGMILVAISHHLTLRSTIRLGPPKDTAHHPAADRIGTYGRRMANYAYPFIIFGMFGWLQFSGDRWLLMALTNKELVGHFLALTQVGVVPVTLGASVLNAFVTPIFFSRKLGADMDRKALLAPAYLLAAAIGVLFVLLTLYGDPVIRLLTSEEYTRYASVLPILVLGSGLFQLGQHFTIYGLQLERSSAYIISKAAIPALYLVLFGVGVRYGGLMGGAYAFVAANFVYLASMLEINRRLSRSRGLIEA